MKRGITILVAGTVAVSVGGAVVLTATPATSPAGLAYFLVTDSVPVNDARADRQSKLMLALVADCMHKQGLPYLPIVHRPAVDPDSSLAPREWVAKHGFGASTRLGLPSGYVEDDPNYRYMESLEPGAQASYRATLVGDGTPTAKGCQGSADAAVLAPRAEAMRSVDELLEELSDAVANDARVDQAEIDWQGCAAKAGLPTSRSAAGTVGNRLFSSRLQQLQSPDGSHDPVKLEHLQSDERRTATALFDCDAAFANTTGPVKHELEAQWARVHSDALTSIRERLIRIDLDQETMARDLAGG